MERDLGKGGRREEKFHIARKRETNDKSLDVHT